MRHLPDRLWLRRLRSRLVAALDPPKVRLVTRIRRDSQTAWHEVYAETGATISAMVDVLGPWLLEHLDDPEIAELVAVARRLQAGSPG